jgi:hypothetical protein
MTVALAYPTSASVAVATAVASWLDGGNGSDDAATVSVAIDMTNMATSEILSI